MLFQIIFLPLLFPKIKIIIPKAKKYRMPISLPISVCHLTLKSDKSPESSLTNGKYTMAVNG